MDDRPLRVDFDRRRKLEVHGSCIISDAGVLDYRELDDALGLTGLASGGLSEVRLGRNTRHLLAGLLRQSVVGRLAGYEDVNDAERLAHDPAMRAMVDRGGLDRRAASRSQMGRFETCWLTSEANLAVLAALCGAWIDRVHARSPRAAGEPRPDLDRRRLFSVPTATIDRSDPVRASSRRRHRCKSRTIADTVTARWSDRPAVWEMPVNMPDNPKMPFLHLAEDANALRIFVPVAIRAIFVRLAPRLAAAAGRPLTPIFDLNPAIPERILAGEAYDIGLTNPPYVDALVAAGLADGASHRPFGRIPLAIGRRAGLGGGVLTDEAGIAALLRGADSIAYTGDGTSGRTYLDAMARLGLSEAVAPKAWPMGAGRPVAAVAAGETELAVGPLTTMMASPGVVPAAIFPAAAGAEIDISVFLTTLRAAGAVDVLDVLTGSELDTELAAAGVIRFEPCS